MKPNAETFVLKKKERKKTGKKVFLDEMSMYTLV